METERARLYMGFVKIFFVTKWTILENRADDLQRQLRYFENATWAINIKLQTKVPKVTLFCRTNRYSA